MAKCACAGRVVQNRKMKMLWSKGLNYKGKWSGRFPQALGTLCHIKTTTLGTPIECRMQSGVKWSWVLNACTEINFFTWLLTFPIRWVDDVFPSLNWDFWLLICFFLLFFGPIVTWVNKIWRKENKLKSPGNFVNITPFENFHHSELRVIQYCGSCYIC